MRDEKHMELIAGYFQGALDDRQEAELRALVAQGLILEHELQGLEQLHDRLSELPEPEPGPKLKANFYEMLHAHKQREQQGRAWFDSLRAWFIGKNQGQMTRQSAYTLVILALGAGLGFWFSPARHYQTQLTQLTEEVQQMREMMMLTLLEQPSATDRLKAVNISSDPKSTDSKVIEALLKTLNHDPNVNVRLATIEALYPHTGNPVVREGLIQSISQQESPLVQMALADMMVALQEKKSVEHLRQLLHREDLNVTVQTKVQESINVLL